MCCCNLDKFVHTRHTAQARWAIASIENWTILGGQVSVNTSMDDDVCLKAYLHEHHPLATSAIRSRKLILLNGALSCGTKFVMNIPCPPERPQSNPTTSGSSNSTLRSSVHSAGSIGTPNVFTYLKSRRSHASTSNAPRSRNLH